MGRRQFNDGMEIIFQDFNKMGATIERELYDRVIYELVQRAEDSMFGDSFLVNFSSSSQVNINAGVGFQSDVTQVSPEPEKRLLYRSANVSLNITAPDLTNDRIDLVVVKAARVDGATESRKFKNASTDVITNENLVIDNEWEAELIMVDGTPAGSPSAPAVPAGYIKLAEVLVSAVTGIAGAGAITDSRNLMPIGASATINSLAFTRLTQSAALTMQQALAETDAFLKDSEWDTNTIDDSVTDPAAPAAGKLIIYNKGGVLFTRESGGSVAPLGSGGGGGGAGANWQGDALEEEEFGQNVYRYAQGDAAKMTLFVKVPDSYLAGRQVAMELGAYSPAASNDWKMQVVSTLIRQGQDAVNSTANQETNNTGDIVNDQAYEYAKLSVDVSTAIGQINGFAVNPGDLIKLELTRIAPAGTEDTEDIRFIPSATEVKFG